MPLRELTTNDLAGAILPETEATLDPTPIEGSAWGAAFRQEFTPASLAAKYGDKPGILTPIELEQSKDGSFNYEDHIPPEFEEFKEEYAQYALSERHANWVTENLRQQQRDRQLVDESGATGFIASSFAAMVSPEQWPTYFIPATVLLKPGILTGSRASLVATQVGIAGGGAALGEGLLHGTQATRTTEESVFAISASAVFAGLITGGILTFKGVGKSAQNFAADLDNDIKIMDGDARVDDIDPRNMGAAEAQIEVVETHRALVEDAQNQLNKAVEAGDTKLAEVAQTKLDGLEKMAPETLSELKHPKLAKALGWASPAIRLAGSRVHAAREMAALLIDDPMVRVRNQYGDALPPSVEARMSQFEQESGFKVQEAMDVGYSTYKRIQKESGEVALSRQDFSIEVSRAMRNGDEAVNGDELVSKTAKMLRSEISDPIQARLDEQDLLERQVTDWTQLTPEDLDGLVEPDIIKKFFKEDGTPKKNIKNMPADARDVLVRAGKLQTEIRTPTGDKSYLHRAWDFTAIREQPAVFEKRVSDYFYGNAEVEIRSRTIGRAEKNLQVIEEAAEVAELKAAKVKKKPTVIERSYDELQAAKARGEVKGRRSAAQEAYDLRQELGYIRDVEMVRAKQSYDAQLTVAKNESLHAARELRAKIEGSEYDPAINANRSSFQVGPLKERTLNIPSKIVDEFLENDIEMVMRQYVRGVNPTLHFKEVFDPSPAGSVKVGKDPQMGGSNAFTAKMGEVGKMYDDMAMDAFNKGDAKLGKQIRKEWENVSRDMEAMHLQLFHRYKQPENPGGFWHQARQRLKEFNVMTMLGMVTVSSIPDVGNYIARRGLRTFARDMSRLATNMKAMKLSANVNRKLGMAADLMNSGRLEKLYLMDDYQAPISKTTTGGKVLRGWKNTQQVFTKATGMPYWNNFWKSMTATSYIDDIVADSLRAAKGELSDAAMEQYARGGISLKDLQAISRQLKESRDMVDGVWVPQVEEWADQRLAERFKAAVRKEVDMTVVTPGTGDLPLASKGEIGKLVFQFKSFSMAANNRILLAGLDDMTASRIAGTMAMVTLGYVSYAARQNLKGKEVKVDYDTFIREGIDRSGLLAYWGDLNGMVSKATTGEADMFRLLGADKGQLSRYASRNLLGSVMGVSAGRLSDLGQISSGVASGDFREADLRAVRRSILFNNLWATHRGFTEIEKALGGSQ